MLQQLQQSQSVAPRIPPLLAANCRGAPDYKAWLARLPSTLHRLAQQWSLELGDPFESAVSWVAPVTLSDGASAVLKLGMHHMEGLDEIAGLIFWNGDPTVRILRSDEKLNAMLLDHCEPGTSLRTELEDQQDVVVAGLLRRLWRTPPQGHPFRPLAEMLWYWNEKTVSAIERWPDAHLVREGLNLLADLPRSSPASVLLATDLHAGGVLRATRLPWLAIDPKPFLGDPAFDVTQHLFNCPVRMNTRPRETIRRMADLLELDSERIRGPSLVQLEPRSEKSRIAGIQSRQGRKGGLRSA